MKSQEGLFLLVAAVAIAVLWLRGYLTSWINAATTAIGQAPTKTPFNFGILGGGAASGHGRMVL